MAFFEVFFGERHRSSLSETQLKSGLSQFRLWALLCEGNFRHPYQDWRQASDEHIRRCWGGFASKRTDLAEGLNGTGRTARIQRISSESTYATGVMSAVSVMNEFRVALGLCRGLQLDFDSAFARQQAVRAGLLKPDQELVPHELSPRQRAELSRWAPERALEVASELAQRLAELARVREQATTHTEEYLIAEKIDIYVATSMRETWEFVETATFLEEIFERSHPTLKHLDYFDPTQSYLTSPVDKGLLEGLMLNRVKATLYMAQESDTLGKDSELASTLAQGKPVIAFVPRILDTGRADPRLSEAEEAELGVWTQKFQRRPMSFFRKRLLLLIGGDVVSSPEFGRLCTANGVKNVSELLDQFFESINDFDPLFSSVSDEHDQFRASHQWFPEFVRMFVLAEAANFDKRATVLKQYHPLGLQISVSTGTANGVLVVRTREECERLLEAMLLNDADFRVVKETWGTSLVEAISQSRFRAVTEHPVLTASFWNFFKPVAANQRRARVESEQ
ncbi:MAG: hypothetical protein AB7G23_19040 [Vicinamibacterales bacterium]